MGLQPKGKVYLNKVFYTQEIINRGLKLVILENKSNVEKQESLF